MQNFLRPITKRLLKAPLRVALVVPFVAQISTAVGLTAFFSLKNGQKAVNEVASQLRTEIVTRIHQHITDYMKTPQIVTHMNSYSVGCGELNLKSIKSLERHFWHQMQLFKSLSPIAFASTKGEIHSVDRLNNGSLVIRVINKSTGGKYHTYTTDSQGNRLKLIRVNTTFDPRTRPWYTKAVKVGQFTWTEIYPYFSSSGLAISATQPLYDETGSLCGVTNATQSLSQLSNFLDSLKIGRSGQTFIIERSGDLVASSMEQPFILSQEGGEEKGKRLKANESSDRITRLTTQYLQQNFSNFNNIYPSQQLEFEIDGKRQYIQIMPFTDGYGLDWVIVVVVPEADFMEHIEANTQITVLLCLGALILATVIGLKTSHCIAQPILSLSEASKEIANGKLDQIVTVEGIKELRVLAEAHNQMATQLQESFAQLLEANRQLEAEITERKQAESALRLSEERFRLALDNIPDTFVIYDAERRLQFINAFGVRRSGYPKEVILGSTDEELFPPEVTNSFLPILCQTVETRTLQTGECKISLPGSDPFTIVVTYVPLLNEHGEIHQILGITHDITQRKRAEEQLLQNAFYDVLTGLPNRALFMNRLGVALEQKKRHEDYLFAVLFLDLDRFKLINDSLGHLLGDQFLIEIARRLESCLRSTDTAARLGGDEFTVLLDPIENVSNAIQVAERIQQELALPFTLNEQEVSTTASIGIALSSALDYNQPQDVLRDADTAMYRAKALGGACYELFNLQMYEDAVARLQLEIALRQAIERQEFQVYYQPIVSLSSGTISGFEALLRWQHPERGLVSPTDFIPIAEETGLIVSIGYWVLHEACRQMQAWRCNELRFPGGKRTNSLNKISVNLSIKQFSQSDLIEQMAQILHSTGLDACSLVLEITESVIMENGNETTVAFSKLREMGIELSIDDFGTGYSSLSRLHNFPISTLKIDRSFVSPIDNNGKNLEMIETIVTLAHKLGVDVTAEGVETKEQLAFLRRLNCEYGQGYFFSQPLDSSAATALIMTNSQW